MLLNVVLCTHAHEHAQSAARTQAHNIRWPSSGPRVARRTSILDPVAFRWPTGGALETRGLETNGLETNGLGTSGLESNGLEANGLETNGLETNGLETNGLETKWP